MCDKQRQNTKIMGFERWIRTPRRSLPWIVCLAAFVFLDHLPVFAASDLVPSVVATETIKRKLGRYQLPGEATTYFQEDSVRLAFTVTALAVEGQTITDLTVADGLSLTLGEYEWRASFAEASKVDFAKGTAVFESTEKGEEPDAASTSTKVTLSWTPTSVVIQGTVTGANVGDPVSLVYFEQDDGAVSDFISASVRISGVTAEGEDRVAQSWDYVKMTARWSFAEKTAPDGSLYRVGSGSLSATSDSTRPTVTITSPAHHMREAQAKAVPLKGRASDNDEIDRVMVQLDEEEPAEVTFKPGRKANAGTWSVDPGALSPGVHTFKVTAVDRTGIESKPVVRQVIIK